jgi:transmembrane sensor
MNEQIYQEASDWLIRNRDGGVNTAEKRLFDAWLRRSPEHVRAYLELSAIWERVPYIPAVSIADADGLVARARAEPMVHHLEPPARSVKLPTERASKEHARRTAAIAATVLIAISGVTLWYQSTRGTYATDIGEQRSVVLTDGSMIELNARSRIRVHFSPNRRDLDLLDGQALFRVAHDAGRPFLVHIGGTTVQAVGTQFDVYRKKTGTVVSVVEGRVSVSSGDFAPPAGRSLLIESDPDTSQSTGSSGRPSQRVRPSGAGSTVDDAQDMVFLNAGQQLTVPPTAAGTTRVARPIPTPANTTTITAWTQRSLVFESTPLTQVADEFNRYNARQLIVSDERLARFHISGVFSSVDPALLLRFLRAQPELTVTETEKEIRISKK